MNINAKKTIAALRANGIDLKGVTTLDQFEEVAGHVEFKDEDGIELNIKHVWKAIQKAVNITIETTEGEEVVVTDANAKADDDAEDDMDDEEPAPAKSRRSPADVHKANYAIASGGSRIGTIQKSDRRNYETKIARSAGLARTDKNAAVFSSAEMAEAFGALVIVNAYEDMAAARKSFSPKHLDYARGVVEDFFGKAASDSLGYPNLGALVPTEFDPDILVLKESYGVARREFGSQPMVSRAAEYNKLGDDITVQWETEGNDITETTPDIDPFMLMARTLTALWRTSLQSLNYTPTKIADVVAREMVRKFEHKADTAAFVGTGLATQGLVVGIVTRLLATPDGSGEAASVVTGTGSGWSGLIEKDFNKMEGNIVDGDVSNYKYFASRQFYSQVMRPIAQAKGGATPLDTTSGSSNVGEFHGFPVEFAQVMASSSASGHIPCVLGNVQDGCKFGTVNGSDRLDTSEHRYFEKGQIAMRKMEDIAINVDHGIGTATEIQFLHGLKTG